MKSINPVTEQVIKEYAQESILDVQTKLHGLQTNFLQWKLFPIEKRISLLNNVANILENNKIAYAAIITNEMGKLKNAAVQEIEKCTMLCRYYIEHGKKFLEHKIIATESSSSYVVYEPLGIILGVMPWNYPFWQVFRFAIPTILAGNVILLKHASNVPGSALAIEEIFTAAAQDLNVMLYKNIFLDSEDVAQVIAEPLVQAVSLTGSVNAGKSVASAAGACVKKTVLELGGSDPYIILADADLDNAVIHCAKGRLGNTGQSCVAAKRFIVVESIYAEFLSRLKQYFSQLKMGDPNKDGVDIGPLANKQIFDTVQQQVQRTINAGAKCYYGGDRVGNTGYFMQPTILINIPQESPGYKEEIFGPVACVFKVPGEIEAIALANDSSFGLGAAIFSADIPNAVELATKHLNAGMIFINAQVISDPRLPFGGVKQSGYGRELSEFGIHEFVNVKTISIA